MLNIPDLVIASVLIQQRDDWFDVVLLDDIQYLWTLDQNTIQHLQDSCHKSVTIHKYFYIGSGVFSMVWQKSTIQYNSPLEKIRKIKQDFCRSILLNCIIISYCIDHPVNCTFRWACICLEYLRTPPNDPIYWPASRGYRRTGHS